MFRAVVRDCEILHRFREKDREFYLVRSNQIVTDEEKQAVKRCTVCKMTLTNGCVYIASSDAFVDRWCKNCIQTIQPNAVPAAAQQALHETACGTLCEALHLTWELRGD